jgi:uncharacterized membrane protein
MKKFRREIPAQLVRYYFAKDVYGVGVVVAVLVCAFGLVLVKRTVVKASTGSPKGAVRLWPGSSV